ncbi:hypothetical protein GCM10008967_39040 [Bacillus carboniphilus]|uniref:Intracellular proteinase inhibitor BsuPI domain-containing protein n=1 Tax=Bacillus carboniphilus TaxID=86663 RepID=A0ABP3GIN2_9BACI
MIKNSLYFFICICLLVFGLFGCGTSNNSEGNLSKEPKNTDESKQVDDFNVTIYVKNREKIIHVYATITYTGEEAEKDIYHGGSIFYFNVYQLDGDFEYFGAMDQPLLKTTLIQNVPHRVQFGEITNMNVKPGTYEFEAIADFSLDSDDVVGTKIEIPVSRVEEIE